MRRKKKLYKVVTPSGRRYLNEDFKSKTGARVAIKDMMVGAARRGDTRAVMNYGRAKVRRVWRQ
jgi:hypothetical protein